MSKPVAASRRPQAERAERMTVRVNPLVGDTLQQLRWHFVQLSRVSRQLIARGDGDSTRAADAISRMQDICAEWGRRGYDVATLHAFARDDGKREWKPSCSECGASLLLGTDWPWNYTKTGRVCNRCRDGAKTYSPYSGGRKEPNE